MRDLRGGSNGTVRYRPRAPFRCTHSRAYSPAKFPDACSAQGAGQLGPPDHCSRASTTPEVGPPGPRARWVSEFEARTRSAVTLLAASHAANRRRMRLYATSDGRMHSLGDPGDGTPADPAGQMVAFRFCCALHAIRLLILT